ncbi:MAG: UDP-N-acetylglucosamine 1-carboxyvinyltransferase [bacterium]|nr:UDP-N-acetylglucosamine 1-carboxyvinyltransferase [bacterium]
MSNFIINGGNKLSGSIHTNSAKNSAIAILCSLLMIEGKTTLSNIPLIEEVNRIVEILISIGFKIKFDNNKLEIINDGKINLETIDKQAYQKTRVTILFIGALVHKYKNFLLPKVSGCKLGKRTVNPHIIALEHFGITVQKLKNNYSITHKQIKGADFTMYESGDTATENAILVAVLADGITKINLASSNYMVQDLCYFLNQAGAKIKGIGTTKLEITGVKKLSPVENYSIMPDPIESMAFISMAITTASKLTITGCPIEFLQLELEKLRIMGQKINISQTYKSLSGYFDLVDIEIIPSHLHALPDKIYGRPFPGLNIDNLPLFIPILTTAYGKTLVNDWVYENRAIYYTELNKLGAKITLLDPHRVIVTGPTKMKPTTINCPPALRPAVNLFIAMLAAKGESVLKNCYSIERGYANLCERLNKIGANIRRE